MTAPLSAERLSALRVECATGIENLSPYVYMTAHTVDSMAAELLTLRAELAARRDPIGYVVFRQYDSGYVAHSNGFVARTLEMAREILATRKPGRWTDHVCALVPVESKP